GSPTLTATASIPGSFTYSPAGVLQVGPAVPVIATFTPSDTADYAGQSATAQITITPAVLTVTANNATRAFGAADPAFSATIAGFVNGDTQAVVTGSAALTSTDTVTSPVGTYPITAAAGTLAAKNYTFTYTAGTLTITQATASAYTITWKNQSAVYGTALGSTTLTATASIPGSFTYSPAGVLQVGPAVPVIATFTPSDTADYAGQSATAQITIPPAVLTVTANNATRAFGAADPAFPATIAGFVNGDPQAVVTGAASLTSTDTVTSPVGTYPITAAAGTLAARNYTFTYAPGTLTITQATASAYTITWKNQTAVYGTALGSTTLTATASIPGTFTYSPAGVLQAGPAVPVIATFTPTDTADYAGQSATAQITITPAVLTVTANNATRAFGAADPAFTATIAGFVNGDTQAVVTGSAALTSTDTVTSPVGTYPITAAQGTIAAKNYTFTYTAGTLTITQATASAYTITWKNQSAVYGTALGSTSLTATASIPGSFTYSPAGVLQVGPAVPVIATFTPSDTADYAGQSATAQITITPAVLTVTANNATRAFGAADPAFTATIAGFVNGDTQAVVTGTASLTSTDTVTSPVGTSPIPAAAGTLAAKNYTFTYTAGTLTITQATASAYTITWKNQSAVYGTALGSTTLTATASIPGSFTYSPAGVLQVGPAVPVIATFTPSDTADYAGQSATAQITIPPAVLTVTANNATRAFGAADPAFTATIAGFVNGDTQAVVTGSA